MSEEPEPIEVRVPSALAGGRLDHVLEQLVPGTSRSRLQKLVRRGLVRRDGKRLLRSNVRVQGGDRLTVFLEQPPPEAPPELRVIFEDEALIVIEKPAGLVAHPTERIASGTLADLARERWGPLPTVMGEERPGIVHRLDRDTSGVVVLPRTTEAMEHLREEFRERRVQKRYLALVHGLPAEERGVALAPLWSVRGHPDRQELAPQGRGRDAYTEWECAERYASWALVACRPRTGRRHQIRVHLASLGHPILADELYALPRSEYPALPDGAPRLLRHALHAAELEFAHPTTGERVRFEAELPEDLAAVRDWLRET